LVGFAQLVTQFGGDCEALLKSAGIASQLLNTPEATLEHAKLLAILEAAAEELDLPDFGLRLARIQGISVLGPVALVAQHASTVGEALAAVTRNIAYHSPGAALRLDVEPPIANHRTLACLRYELHLPQGTAHRQNSELAYTIAFDFLRMISHQPGDDWLIHLSHAKGLSKARYRKHLGCVVRLGQPFEALYFPAKLLDFPVDAADPELVATAERFVSHVVRRHPLDIGKQVETLVIRQLAGGTCTLPVVAKQLTVSERTLQRCLQEQGSSFDQIAEAVRRSRAHELLTQTLIPLTQICAAIGYTESSTFNRSCQRWFNASPLKYRQLHQA
jgi:AraC-like DNA-binding protein